VPGGYFLYKTKETSLRIGDNFTVVQDGSMTATAGRIASFGIDSSALTGGNAENFNYVKLNVSTPFKVNNKAVPSLEFTN
jgi:hypothetical protein